MTTRIVRRGACGRLAITLAAPVMMATPAPSSTAPVPGSQLSRWPPTTSTSCGVSRPTISPEMFQAWALGLKLEAMSRRMRIGFPRAAMWSRSSASTVDKAAAGMPAGAAPPVCGSRVSSVESDRVR